ncbi:AAA family ATPase [Hymenobacter sp. ASUV-10]|uniref:AAA family ATPase n=1 Tax=Hymenobacter aranciens TaxID=3063996 RepID=A0ABT9BC86_9BACT|nr:AAA family ATPase [Hymenobacter sp. ASUV-10]MDO7875880.1 AAA family ATPase [Hymenobacter sp. ASUV-10]
MLTRLKVSGFKNLVDVDVRFGPFTCIAGTNGVGKSNLFDAITFLSYLAEHPLQEAALMVRGGSNLRNLFTRNGAEYGSQIHLEAEMIVPPSGIDDLGQEARASATYLRYRLVLGYEQSSVIGVGNRLVLLLEELTHINRSEARKQLGFPTTVEWRESVIVGRRTLPFISTEPNATGEIVIQRHRDGEPGRRPSPYIASSLTRTLLSVSDAVNGTALLARQEISSWRVLQLEPHALRLASRFTDPPRLTADGAGLPAMLYRLARQEGPDKESMYYAQLGNRLAELNEEVRRLRVDRDDKRELLTLEIEDRSGTYHSAEALSDGTLRFLAFAIIERDGRLGRMLCLEEPENGIHPARIQAVLYLLQDISTDTTMAVDLDNPLRQVIINTHSPHVVSLVPQDSLLVAEQVTAVAAGRKVVHRVQFSAIPNTWRALGGRADATIPIGKLLGFLRVLPGEEIEEEWIVEPLETKGKRPMRLIDRPDVRQLTLALDAAQA